MTRSFVFTDSYLFVTAAHFAFVLTFCGLTEQQPPSIICRTFWAHQPFFRCPDLISVPRLFT